MTISSIKCRAVKKGTTEEIIGFIAYDGTKAYCIPESSTMVLAGGTLTSTGVFEVETNGVVFDDFSSNLETRTVRSGVGDATVTPSTGKIGISSITVKKIEDGQVYDDFEVNDFAYTEIPYKYRNCMRIQPEYEVVDGEGIMHRCYKVQMMDGGHDMGAQIIFKDGTKGLIIPMPEIAGKFFIQKINITKSAVAGVAVAGAAIAGNSGN